MSAEAVTGDLDADDSYHFLILGGLAMRERGYAARRADILGLHAQGKRPPAIARELERRAREGGCSDDQIEHSLGISVHNVRAVLRASGLLGRRVG